MDDEVREMGLTQRAGRLMSLLVEPGTKPKAHIPQRAWTERPGESEISWACSCGCVNKHVPLPANLRCIEDKEHA